VTTSHTLDAKDARAVVFLHVPKTAGSTLRWIIQRQYPAERTVLIEGQRFHDFQAQSDDTRGRVLCLFGHMPFGVHRFLPQGVRYITMLRHPVEWTLSFHSYMERNPQLPGLEGGRGLDVDGFVDFLRRSNITDIQTRMISGQMRISNLPPFDPLSEDALQCAQRNLRTDFECVGVVERFDESLLIMKRKFGWRNVYYRPLNVSEGRPVRSKLPRATLERILACNSRDVELHNEACRLLSQSTEVAGESFQAELRRFARINALYGNLLPLYEASGLSRARQALRRRLKAAR
jgi:hypothetical protein